MRDAPRLSTQRLELLSTANTERVTALEEREPAQ